MKPLHALLLPKKSTASERKTSGYPPLKSSWLRPSLILRLEFLRWFLHEEREIPYQYQLQTSVFRRRVTSWAVIFRATSPCQNRFSVSERRIILNFALQNHLRPVSLPSKIEIVATSSERHLPTAMSYFNQENWFWKWIWKTMGEVDLDFKWAISLRKSIPPSKLFSRNWFSKAPQAFLMLNLSRKS